jgi:hypothetical protein
MWSATLRVAVDNPVGPGRRSCRYPAVRRLARVQAANERVIDELLREHGMLLRVAA